MIHQKTFFIVAADKRPDFISLQMRSLMEFCIGDFELIVLNNSQNKKRTNLIEIECKKSGARHIRVNFADRSARSSHHETVFRLGRYRNPNLACSYPYHWFVRRHLPGLSDANVVFIDSDMFLIKPIDFRVLLSEKSLFFVPQFRGTVSQDRHEVMYPWNGLLIANTADRKLRLNQLEWSPKVQKGFATDVGGASTDWLEKSMREVSFGELLAFGILYVNRNLPVAHSKVSLNGNWNAHLEKVQRLADWKVVSRDSPGLAARILNCNTQAVDDVVIERLNKAISKLEQEVWPDPLWIDFLSAPEFGLDDFIVHYKSGSNYLKWATPEYNSLKTRALTNCFPALK